MKRAKPIYRMGSRPELLLHLNNTLNFLAAFINQHRVALTQLAGKTITYFIQGHERIVPGLLSMDIGSRNGKVCFHSKSLIWRFS